MDWTNAQFYHNLGSLLLSRFFDVAVVSVVVYRLLLLARGTRAWQIMWGIGLFVLALWVSEHFHLLTLHWLLDKGVTLGPVAVVILLYPELRQALEQFGRLGFWRRSFGVTSDEQNAQAVDEVLLAVAEMASRRMGALIVFERINRIDPIAESGVIINAQITSRLLKAIFSPGNPLHDGAVVIRGDRILAAACQLPMSESPLDSVLHMRHRAALGIAEESDALCVVVSEERGQISISAEGILQRGVTLDQLRDTLLQVYRLPSASLAPLLKLRRQMDKAVAKVRNRSGTDVGEA